MSVYPNNSYKDNNMFAHLRTHPGANYRFITTTVATNMRDHVRNQRPILTGLDPSNTVVAGILADIYLREFACAIKTLNAANYIAGRYHEHAFDNTDAYIEGQMPTQTHEMNAEQRHAAQLLLGVGNSYSEINATLRMLDSRMLDSRKLGGFQAVTECNPEMRAQLSQQFSADASFAEDAFDRLHHLVKQVWSLVNMLAFSNLFRFADHPMVLPSSEDSIFIPHIPSARQAEEVQVEEVQVEEEVHVQQTRHECNDCGKTFRNVLPQHVVSPDGSEFYRCHSCAFKQEFPDEYIIGFTDDESDEDEPEHFNEIAEQLADEKITPEQACSMLEELRDAGIIADATDAQNEQQKGFNEIAMGLADWKITTEEACDLFAEWMTECVNASDS